MVLMECNFEIRNIYCILHVEEKSSIYTVNSCICNTTQKHFIHVLYIKKIKNFLIQYFLFYQTSLQTCICELEKFLLSSLHSYFLINRRFLICFLNVLQNKQHHRNQWFLRFLDDYNQKNQILFPFWWDIFFYFLYTRIS